MIEVEAGFIRETISFIVVLSFLSHMGVLLEIPSVLQCVALGLLNSERAGSPRTQHLVEDGPEIAIS